MSPRRGQAGDPGDRSSASPVRAELAALAEVKFREYLLRFAFGAGIAVVAGLVGARFGPRAGGLFLAFPATLPASLTLVEDKQSTDRASADIKGGVLGGLGLVAFALVALVLLGIQPAAALAAALVAWSGVAAGLYFAIRHTRFFRDA